MPYTVPPYVENLVPLPSVRHAVRGYREQRGGARVLSTPLSTLPSRSGRLMVMHLQHVAGLYRTPI